MRPYIFKANFYEKKTKMKSMRIEQERGLVKRVLYWSVRDDGRVISWKRPI